MTPEVYSILADLGKEEDCKNLADFAISKMGGVDILILNAAYAPKPVMFKETANPVRWIDGWMNTRQTDSGNINMHTTRIQTDEWMDTIRMNW